MASSRKTIRKMDTGDKGGFTIIEVVLVLAIAGLIFLMVFIALPALQRSQRDTQRRNDLARLQTRVMDYQNNNNGKLPNNESVDAVPDGAEAGMDEWECSKTNPNAAKCFILNYMNGANAAENEFIDPRGWAYGLTIDDFSNVSGGTGEFTLSNTDYGEDADHPYMVYMLKKAKCDGEKAISSNNARDYVVVYKLEGSGTYCKDNQ